MSNNRNGYCEWANSSEEYISYHDKEWGIPEYKDKKLFEMLILESFQAGLSWITILKKRNNFKLAFDDFNPMIIANYNNKKIDELMKNEGIIRNHKKIISTIKKLSEIPSHSNISEQISKELKNLGFKFCGPVIIYSFMQATGMVNDHLISCPHHLKCQKD